MRSICPCGCSMLAINSQGVVLRVRQPRKRGRVSENTASQQQAAADIRQRATERLEGSLKCVLTPCTMHAVF